MKAVADGIMEPDQAFRTQMDHCLGCRACEPACPADVKYGQLIEQARDALEDHPKHSAGVSFLRKLFFKGIFPYRRRLKGIARLMQFYQKSGLQRFARISGVMKLFPRHMREFERILPAMSASGVKERMGTFVAANGEPIARVGLVSGCMMDTMFADTNVNTVKLLAASGFEVVIPDNQNCCGALHAHNGEMDTARELARNNIAAFKAANVDYILSNAGGCGALLVEYDHLLHADEKWSADAKWFSERVRDVSDLIVSEGRIPRFAENETVEGEGESISITYQDSCHLRNVMKSSDAPRQLMKRVTGVDYIELKEADRCCGSAGIYNLTQPQLSGQILEHKMAHVHQTQARYVLTSNPGCLLQMQLGIQRHQPEQPMEAMHIVDFLYERMVKPDK